MVWWYWMVLGLALLGAEMTTPGGFYILFFGLSALVVGTLAGLDLVEADWLQWLLFSVHCRRLVTDLSRSVAFSTQRQSPRGRGHRFDGRRGRDPAWKRWRSAPQARPNCAGRHGRAKNVGTVKLQQRSAGKSHESRRSDAVDRGRMSEWSAARRHVQQEF